MVAQPKFFTVVVLALLGASLPVQAQVTSLLFDNFDSYADTAAFTAVWPVVGTQPTALISTTQAFSPTQSVSIPTSVDTPTSRRNQRLFAESGVPTALNPIQFQFRFFESDAAVSPYRQHANLQDGTAPTSSGQLLSMGMNNNLIGGFYMARILGVGVDGGTAGAYFFLNDPGAPVRSNGWHELRAVLSPTEAQFFVDGVLSKTVVTAVFATRSFDVVRIGSGVSSTRDAFYDDMSVSVIPEPTSLTLAGLGLAGVWLRKRRRTAA